MYTGGPKSVIPNCRQGLLENTQIMIPVIVSIQPEELAEAAAPPPPPLPPPPPEDAAAAAAEA